jgi:hypothetical protein
VVLTSFSLFLTLLYFPFLFSPLPFFSFPKNLVKSITVRRSMMKGAAAEKRNNAEVPKPWQAVILV